MEPPGDLAPSASTQPGLIALPTKHPYGPTPSGKAPGITIPLHAVKELFGISITQPRVRPPSISTRVVLEVAGAGPEGGIGSIGDSPLSTASEPFHAQLAFYISASASPGSLPLAQLVHGPLQRAVVGLVRVGVRRVDARTIALVLASPALAARVAQAQAHGQLVPLQPVTYQLMPCGKPPNVYLPQAAAIALFGLEPGALPLATLTTAVMLEVEGGVGAGAPPSRGPFSATVMASGTGQPKLVCAALQREVVGWQRVGMRRIDASTIALVLARPGGQQAQGGDGGDAA